MWVNAQLISTLSAPPTDSVTAYLISAPSDAVIFMHKSLVTIPILITVGETMLSCKRIKTCTRERGAHLVSIQRCSVVWGKNNEWVGYVFSFCGWESLRSTSWCVCREGRGRSGDLSNLSSGNIIYFGHYTLLNCSIKQWKKSHLCSFTSSSCIPLNQASTLSGLTIHIL